MLAALGGLVLGYIAHAARGSARQPAVQRAEVDSPPEPRRKRAEQVLDQLPMAAFLTDRSGRITLGNAAFETTFGVRLRGFAPRPLIEVIPSVQLERHTVEALAGRPATGTVTIRAGSRARTIKIWASPIERGAVVFAADETESIVQERAQREFISNVSHELRTPLASMKLMLETVLADAGSSALFLPKILEEIDRMTQLVADLLESARAEAGELRLRLSTVALAPLIASVVEMFAQHARAASIVLETEVQPGATLHADRDRLARVLVNLIDNALHYTSAGGRVSVQAHCEDRRAVLRVIDTGEGIPFKDIRHIFEPFYVVDRSRSRTHTGTGLGLSIVRQIVEAHGGTVSVASELGRGATFTCVLPVRNDSAAS